jgi:2-polyprenyl-3-methyl-5-hydroxy-6-metoxy-1,4-benzoquinol methylase
MDQNNSIESQILFYNNYWSKNTPLNRLKLLRATKILEYLAVVKQRVKEPRILDFGCGDGRFTSFLGYFGQTEGVELSDAAIENANKNYKHVRFIQGDCLTITLPANEYDVIVSQEVIEHIWEQKKYLEQCHKLLKKKGYLILTTPNKYIFDRMEGGNWSRQPIENIVTYKDMKKLISERFKIITAETIIFNYGSQGMLKVINSKYIIGFLNRIGLSWWRERILSKLGLGLHAAILAQKM